MGSTNPQANILERPATILTASQTPSALFPLSRLHDGRPSQLFIFPSRLEDEWLQVDINQYLNGGFEKWTNSEPNDHTVALTGEDRWGHFTGYRYGDVPKST